MSGNFRRSGNLQVIRSNLRFLWIIIVILFMWSSIFAEVRGAFYSGEITIKMKVRSGEFEDQEGSVNFGSTSLDAISKRFHLNKLEKRFKYNPSILRRQDDQSGLSRIYKVSFPDTIDIYSVIHAFEENPDIEYAEAIPVMYECEAPNDEYYSIEGHLTQIQASEAWDIHHGEDGEEVLIGICDSAVEWKHSDLIDNVYQNLGEDIDGDGHVLEFVNNEWVFDPGDVNNVDDDENGFADDFIGWNFHTDDGSAENDPNGTYINGHGTLVAGLAAGVTNNENGIASISWNVKFLSTKHSMNYLVWPPGVIYDAYDGIIYLAEMGCDIINCSWGGDGFSNADQEALGYARSLGSIIVTAAGNSNSDSNLFFPGNYRGVINVASLRCDNVKADYSNYGIGIDVSAPGGTYGTNRIYSSLPVDSYSYCSGTSFASPIVAGLLGLLKSYHPDWTNDQLVRQVIGTCNDIDQNNPDYTNMLGSGCINAYQALTEDNVNVPQELRLEIEEWLPFNDGNNNILEPGETASLGLVIRNYAHYVSSNNVTFTLNINDDDITIINGSYTGAIESDDLTELEDIFTIQIASDAAAHLFTIEIEIEADIDITFGSEIYYNAYINPGGIFVWDGGTNTNEYHHYSGEYIYDYLCEHDISAIYSQEMPASLAGFDAAFLCFGNYGEGLGTDTPLINIYARTIQDYLEAGGYLYLEGGSSLGYYQKDNTELHHLFGIQMQDSGECDSSTGAITGQENTLTEGITFMISDQSPRYYLDRYLPYGSGSIAFTQIDYGNVAVQNEGSYGQKTFCSAYSISGFRDRPFTSRRRVLLARILKFMDFPVMEANFDVELPPDFAPHVPITLTFNDNSVIDDPITSRQWDFDNDGTIDCYDQSATWTFTEPGYQNILYTITDGVHSSSYLSSNCLYFYNGETSLLFGPEESWECNVTIPAAGPLNLTDNFTLEMWIYPTQWVSFEMANHRILDKNSIYLRPVDFEAELETEETLVICAFDETGEHNICTPDYSISLNEWQHIAVSYDDNSNMRVYINGIEQELVSNTSLSGILADNSEYALTIGNTGYSLMEDDMGCFEGCIDDVRIWNTVRSGTEIYENKDLALEGTENGLAGYWNMNEAIGDTLYDLTQNQNNGSIYAATWTLGAIEPTTAIDEDGSMVAPVNVQLYPNYPNPFNPTTTIRFNAGTVPSKVSLSVFNIKGQKVRQLIENETISGEYSIVWDGRNESGHQVTSGVYFYRLRSGSDVITNKALLLK